MIKLSRTVAYAIQASLQLAKADSETPVPCSRLAADGEMPERFLLQILRNLVTHGILKSTRGVEGGYKLARRPEKISILDVIEAIEGPLSSESAIVNGLDETARENLRATLETVAATVRKQFESVSLSQIIGATNGHGTAGTRVES
ncbi:RrF2 family transcriptional regulator [Planctomycetota bacterium]